MEDETPGRMTATWDVIMTQIVRVAMRWTGGIYQRITQMGGSEKVRICGNG